MGYYGLQKEMPAADALEVLVDPDNILKNTVTVPEGLRVADIVDVLADKTDFSKAQFEKVLANPEGLGLPGCANGNAEGYLFLPRGDWARRRRPSRSASDDGGALAAGGRGRRPRGGAKGSATPRELMIVTLVEAEAARDADRGKVARVIYNRLEGDEAGGLLQIDASVNYGLQQEYRGRPDHRPAPAGHAVQRLHATRAPPTPIEAPGDAAIAAAAHPTEGDWYYYVTTDLRTGETKFASTYDEFLGYKREFQKYCETSDAC